MGISNQNINIEFSKNKSTVIYNLNEILETQQAFNRKTRGLGQNNIKVSLLSQKLGIRN
ncbi:MAG: hypothetical protein P8Y70_18905 [Candidatus Lokiarchaeota archaeon]